MTFSLNLKTPNWVQSIPGSFESKTRLSDRLAGHTVHDPVTALALEMLRKSKSISMCN